MGEEEVRIIGSEVQIKKRVGRRIFGREGGEDRRYEYTRWGRDYWTRKQGTKYRKIIYIGGRGARKGSGRP